MAGRVATVTLLFSDIEGSTRLWEDHPEEMGTALARHDERLHKAMSGSGGHVFKTLGDGFCVVFELALDAMAAALATQRSLIAEPWPGVVQPRVRVALHSGECELRDSDYFGRPVNRVARLLAAGHGGQTLVSEATAQRLRDVLPDGVELRDLGVHRLRDLGDPEHIYQVDAPGLESTFKPLRTLANPALANNLPLQTASFVGRSRELEAVAASLDASRLVTLAGAGGCGKTRLAVQVAADLLDDFVDGVWLVELAPLRAPELVVEALATTVGVSVPPGRALPALLDTLSDRTMLVVLDNCEHVVEAAAKLAEAVLQACPNVKLLCTSRERLGVDGELVYRVPSLPVPDAEVVEIDRLTTFDAVRLFAERAVQHDPGFVLDESNGAAVASVCRRLDSIPLAIELAAARLGVLSVAEVDGRLDQRFRLLTTGSRTALPRQQTLRALVDWSWDCSRNASAQRCAGFRFSPAAGPSKRSRPSCRRPMSTTGRCCTCSARSSTRASSRPTPRATRRGTSCSRRFASTRPSSSRHSAKKRCTPLDTRTACTTSRSPRPRRRSSSVRSSGRGTTASRSSTTTCGPQWRSVPPTRKVRKRGCSFGSRCAGSGAHEIAAGRLGEARLHLLEVLEIARNDRDQINPVYARSNLGLLAIVEGGYEEARHVFVESLSSARRIGLQASVCVFDARPRTRCKRLW